MSSLTPEVRVNKLGHSVTKHVKQQTAPSMGRKQLPAPVAVDPAASKLATIDAMKTLRDAGVPLRNNSFATKNLYHLASNNPELLERVIDHVRSSDSDEKSVWEATLSGVQRHPVGKGGSYDASLLYERDMAVLPIASQVAQDTGDAHGTKVLENIEKCLDGMETDGTDEPAVLSASLVVMEYDRALNSTYNYTFDNTQYAGEIAHIAEHPEEVAPILGELIKRGTLDSEVIDSILNVSAPSLREGAL